MCLFSCVLLKITPKITPLQLVLQLSPHNKVHMGEACLLSVATSATIFSHPQSTVFSLEDWPV